MPEEDSRAGEMQQADEVLYVVFPARDQSTEIVESGKEALDLPAPADPTQTAAVLSDAPPSATMGRDHLNAVGRHQEFVERVTVVASIADQPRREVREEAGVEGRGDEVRLIR